MNLQQKVPDTFFTTAAALSLGCVLAVVLVSAAIRLGSGFSVLSGFQLMVLRGIHRTAASLEVLAVLWLAWMAWSARRAQPRRALAAGLALAVTAFLSVLGILAGQDPPPAAAMANLLGGLALTAIFAWLLGALEPDRAARAWRSSSPPAVCSTLQVFLGARLSICRAVRRRAARPRAARNRPGRAPRLDRAHARPWQDRQAALRLRAGCAAGRLHGAALRILRRGRARACAGGGGARRDRRVRFRPKRLTHIKGARRPLRNLAA